MTNGIQFSLIKNKYTRRVVIVIFLGLIFTFFPIAILWGVTLWLADILRDNYEQLYEELKDTFDTFYNTTKDLIKQWKK